MEHLTGYAAVVSITCLGLLLNVGIVYDFLWSRIPNILLATALVLALTIGCTIAGVTGFVSAVGGLIVGLAILLPFYAVGGMGAGDVKLLGVAGAFLGPMGALVAGLFTLAAGGVLGVGVIAWRMLARYSPSIHVLPLKLAGFLETRFAVHPVTDRSDGLQGGRRLTSTEVGAVRIPYAPAIGIGVFAALWFLDYLSLV